MIQEINTKSNSNSNSNSEREENKSTEPDKIIIKKETVISTLNKTLRNYLKENKKITIFVSILLLFRKKKYQNIEYYDMYNHLLNEFSQNSDKYILENKKNTNANTDDANSEDDHIKVNEFLDDIDFELNNSQALNIIINGEEKMIELDVMKAL